MASTQTFRVYNDLGASVLIDSEELRAVWAAKGFRHSEPPSEPQAEGGASELPQSQEIVPKRSTGNVDEMSVPEIQAALKAAGVTDTGVKTKAQLKSMLKAINAKG